MGDKMIVWRPSIYVPGIGVVYLTQDDIDRMYPGSKEGRDMTRRPDKG